MNRRNWLKWGALTGGTAAVATPLILSLDPSATIEDPSSAAVFGHGEGSIPMNAANLTPMLQPIGKKISEYSGNLNRDVSFINRLDIVEKTVSSSRQKVAKMLGISDPADLAFVRNTSEANSIINNGLTLKKNDEVVVWDQNHATNHRSWQYRQQQLGFAIKQVMLPTSPETIQQVVEAFLAKLTPNTKVVTFTELSNISGTRLPAMQLCEAIHQYNTDILVHIDGAQSWGCVDVDIEKIGCDSFSSSAHKWLMGPRGTGILYVNKKWAQQIMPSTLGYDFSLNYPDETLPDDAQRFECLGQRDVAPYAAIGDTVDLYNQLGGSQKIEQSIQAHTQYALNGLDAAGIKTLTPRNINQNHHFGHGVVIADMNSTASVYGAFLALHNAGIASAFISGARVCCQPLAEGVPEDRPTYLRLSPHIYNSNQDIDKAIEIIKRVHSSKFEIVKEVVRFL